jgi:hypothetical protein
MDKQFFGPDSTVQSTQNLTDHVDPCPGHVYRSGMARLTGNSPAAFSSLAGVPADTTWSGRDAFVFKSSATD